MLFSCICVLVCVLLLQMRDLSSSRTEIAGMFHQQIKRESEWYHFIKELDRQRARGVQVRWGVWWALKRLL